jgi:hypothetical protein
MWLVLTGISKGQVDKATQDFWAGLNAWRQWSLLGLNDVRMRYRRSSLGPFPFGARQTHSCDVKEVFGSYNKRWGSCGREGSSECRDKSDCYVLAD